MPTKTNRRHEVGQRTENWPNDMQEATSKAGAVAEDAIEYLRNYVHEKPETAALWCLGIGFVLGWKLKPW
jgi:hypothetical protein